MLNYISYNFNLHATGTAKNIIFLLKHMIEHILISMLLQWFDLTSSLELPLNNHLVHLMKVGVFDSLPIRHNSNSLSIMNTKHEGTFHNDPLP
jgi:hypothetical protein